MVIESEILDQATGVFIDYIPQLTKALFLFFFGIVSGYVLAEIIRRAYKFSKIEAFLKKMKLSTTFIGVPLGDLISEIIKWFTIITFMQESVRTLSLEALNKVLGDILGLIPLLGKSGLIFYVGILVGEYFRNQIKDGKLPHKELIAVSVYVAISYLAAVIALSELYPQGTQVLNIVLAVVLSAVGFGISLGVGLAVGLGSKDYVSKLISEYFKK